MKPRPPKTQPCPTRKSKGCEAARLLDQANDLCAKVKPKAGGGVKVPKPSPQ